MSKYSFKKLISQKIDNVAVKYLVDLAQSHSKSKSICDGKFERKSYFSDHRFSKENKQFLFKMRTKTLDLKSNFKSQYQDLCCRICKDTNTIEDEDHIVVCSGLNNEESDTKFSDVFENADKQLKAVKFFKKIMRKRELILETRS